MEHQSTKGFSTISTSDVENSVENVETVENSKNHVENSTKIPFIVYEATMARMERHIKRLWIALIVAITLIFASNFIWLAYINQYDFESYEYSQDGQGLNIIGNENGVEWHGAKVDSQEKNEEE